MPNLNELASPTVPRRPNVQFPTSQSTNQQPTQSTNQQPTQSTNQKPIQSTNQQPANSTNQQPTQTTKQPTQPTDQRPTQSIGQQIQPPCIEPFIPQSPPSVPPFHSTRSKSQRSNKDLATQFVRRSRRQKGLQPDATKEVPPSTPRDHSSIIQSSVTLPPPPVHIPPPFQTLPNSGIPPSPFQHLIISS